MHPSGPMLYVARYNVKFRYYMPKTDGVLLDDRLDIKVDEKKDR